MQPGARVAYIDRSAPEVIELLFAAAKTGAVAVPLNWRLAVPELTAILEDARPALLIAGHAYEATAETVLSRLETPPGLVRVARDYESWLAGFEAVDPGERGESGDADRADVHVRDHRGSKGRPHDPPQPRGSCRDLAALGIRCRLGQPDAAADIPHRRDRMGLSGALERRDDNPRQ